MRIIIAMAVMAVLSLTTPLHAQSSNRLPYAVPNAQQAESLRMQASRLAANPPRSLEGQSDLACMAVAVYHESRGESVDGQRAVASVVLQRTLVPDRWGSSPCEVVRPVQFSFMTSRWGYAPIRDMKAWELAVRVALTITLFGPDAHLQGADHYHTPAVFPSWRLEMDRIATVGFHHFYVDPDSVKISREKGMTMLARGPDYQQPSQNSMAFAASTQAANTGSGGFYNWGEEGVPDFVAGTGPTLVASAPTKNLYDGWGERKQNASPAKPDKSSGGFSPVRGPDVMQVAQTSRSVGLKSTKAGVGIQVAQQSTPNGFKPLGIQSKTD